MKRRVNQDVPHDHFSTSDDFDTLINGDPPPSEDAEIIHRWVIEVGYHSKECSYCRNSLMLRTYQRGSFDGGGGCYAELAECHNCSYWQLFVNQYSDLPGLPSNVGWYAWLSKLRQFDEIPPECSAELAQALRRAPAAWHSMRPQVLERLVADVFRANFATAEVFHVGRPADGGVDILFLDAGVKCLVQVKRREHPRRGEGVVAIRNLLGAMLLEDALRGIVVSTADHFTYRAFDAVGRAAERGITIELVDRGKLDRMLDPVLPRDAWRSVLSAADPEFYRQFIRRSKRDGSGPALKGRRRNNPQMQLFPDED